MKKNIILLLAFLSLTAFANDELKVATEAYYPPFAEMNASGEVVGFDVDIIKAVCEEMKRKCSISNQDWDSLVPSLISKKFDMVIAAMSITPERLEIVSFSDPYDPYAEDYNSFLKLKTSKVSSYDQIKKGNYNIGVLKASVQETFLQKNKIKKVVPYDSSEQAFLDLKAGRIDLVFMEDFLSKHYTTRHNELLSIINDKNLKIENSSMGIAVRKDDKELLTNINKALTTIKSNGAYEKIKKKYFGN